jgi:hypothetical protein
MFFCLSRVDRTRDIETKRAQMPDRGRLRPMKEKLFLFRADQRHSRLGRLAGAEALREFLHASGGIDELLLAGEKGMAGRANTEAQVLFSGAGMIDGAAGADDLAFHVFGVDIGFHGELEKLPDLK